MAYYVVTVINKRNPKKKKKKHGIPIWSENGTAILKTVLKEGLLASFFLEITFLRVHGTDFVLDCPLTVVLKICDKYS